MGNMYKARLFVGSALDMQGQVITSDPRATTVTPFATVELALLRERDREFVGEYKRWYDLLRLQDAARRPLAFSPAAAYPDDPTQSQSSTGVLRESEPQKLLWPVDVNTLNGDNLLRQTELY